MEQDEFSCSVGRNQEKPHPQDEEEPLCDCCGGGAYELTLHQGLLEEDLQFGYEESEEVPMTVDTCEDVWTRLHDIRVNGCMMEYAGSGRTITDNGLAQSNAPLTPANHYFQVRIINPGHRCYIAIGLARKDYPVYKHPGWNRGSIAYHADDGKIFVGSGQGTPFGPPSALHDVLGCGILFPPLSHINSSYEDCEWPWELDGGALVPKMLKKRYYRRGEERMGNVAQGGGASSSDSEDELWWNNQNQVYPDRVKVFFMRNGRLLGMKEVRIPRGGFYPTIGMLSSNEKVVLDMSPLSG